MSLEQLKMPIEGEEVAVIITNRGEIRLRLFDKVAPKAVENFKTHARNGYYDGVSFHRVMNEFMIQGGDPEGTGRGGASIWGGAFEDEFDPSYHNLRGALSMANSGPNTNGSQFFIVQKTDIPDHMIEEINKAGEEGGYTEEIIETYKKLGGTPWLDFRHTVFGQVFQGMEVVDEIAFTDVDRNSKPVNPIIMEKVEIEKFTLKK